MDQREKQFQSLNICQRLYHLMKFLARHAHKMVSSGGGSPMPRLRLAQAPAIPNEANSKSDQQVHPIPQTTPPHEGEHQQVHPIHEGEQAMSASNTASEEKEEEAALTSNSSQPKAPKKMVSINENVETIYTSKKKQKKEQAMLDEPKPLKSILKVPSDVNNTTDNQSLFNRANGA